MLATCIYLNGSLLDQLSCTIVYLHNLFTCTLNFGRINMFVCLSVCQWQSGQRLATASGKRVCAGHDRRSRTFKDGLFSWDSPL